MAEVFSYSLDDFLLFSSEVYWRLIQSHLNSLAWWPLAIEISSLLFLAISMKYRKQVFVSLFLILIWLTLAWFFYLEKYAEINTFSVFIGYACLLQVVMLLLNICGSKKYSFSNNTHQHSLYLVALLMVITFPVISYFLFGFWQAGIVAVMPIPTFLLTMVLLANYTRIWRFLLFVIPSLILLIELLTLMQVMK